MLLGYKLSIGVEEIHNSQAREEEVLVSQSTTEGVGMVQLEINQNDTVPEELEQSDNNWIQKEIEETVGLANKVGIDLKKYRENIKDMIVEDGAANDYQ